MEGKQKQKQDTMVSKKKKKKNHTGSSSDDEDSDVEKNFALLTKRGGAIGGAEKHEDGDEEFEGSDEEVEDGSDGTDEEESDGGEDEEEHSEGSDVGEQEESDDSEEEGDEDSESSEASEDDMGDGDEDLNDGCGSESQTKEDIRKELSSMSFEDIMKLQSKVGTKVYNEIAYGSSSKTQETKKKKRLNRNRPMEISAKKPAPFLRQVVPVRKTTLRDPRFDDLSGEYKPEIFEKTYKFINDIRMKEKETIQKKLGRMKKNSQNKEKLQFLLKRMENQERARQLREQQRERELEFKRQQRERAIQGAHPFFLKKSEKKKLQLAEKYQELKKSGKLENFLSKKRKRNATKDRKKLPKQL